MAKPKYDHKNPHPDFTKAVERNNVAEKRVRELRRKIRGLEKQAIEELKKYPLNMHARHEFELVRKEGQKIVCKYILTVRQDGHDFRIVYTDGSPTRLFDDRINVLNVFLEQCSG